MEELRLETDWSQICWITSVLNLLNSGEEHTSLIFCTLPGGTTQLLLQDFEPFSPCCMSLHTNNGEIPCRETFSTSSNSTVILLLTVPCSLLWGQMCFDFIVLVSAVSVWGHKKGCYSPWLDGVCSLFLWDAILETQLFCIKLQLSLHAYACIRSCIYNNKCKFLDRVLNSLVFHNPVAQVQGLVLFSGKFSHLRDALCARC